MDGVSRTIGELQGTVHTGFKNQERQFLELRDLIATSSARADIVRDSMAADIGHLRKDVDMVAAQTQQNANAISMATPTIEEFKRMQAEVRGGLRLGKFLYTMGGVLGTGILWLVSRLSVH